MPWRHCEEIDLHSLTVAAFCYMVALHKKAVIGLFLMKYW